MSRFKILVGVLVTLALLLLGGCMTTQSSDTATPEFDPQGGLVQVLVPCYFEEERVTYRWVIDPSDPVLAQYELEKIRQVWAGLITPEAFVEAIAGLHEEWREVAENFALVCADDEVWTRPGAASA